MTTEVYVASNMPYEWLGKLQHAGYANERIRATCETYIADSDINDPDSGNAAVLELATELDADYMLPADTLGDPEATATAVAEFRDLRPQYDTDATTLYPLQPPHLRAWRDAGRPEHVAVGGVRDAAASTVIRVLESLRDVRDEETGEVVKRVPIPNDIELGVDAEARYYARAEVRDILDQLTDLVGAKEPEQVEVMGEGGGPLNVTVERKAYEDDE